MTFRSVRLYGVENAMYQSKNPEKYKRKAQETLKVFKQTRGDAEKTAVKLNRSVRTIYRHLNYLGYTFPGSALTRDKAGKFESLKKDAYLKNLEKVRTNGK